MASTGLASSVLICAFIGTALFILVRRVSPFECKQGQGEDGEKLQVHLVPHTHDDVGWLKTVDEYYYGARNKIQHAGVQYILDSVIPALLQDEQRTFIYVEMAFFHRWWIEQNDQMRITVRKLVKTRQLEFINGGWCMNDEAATHYNAIIDQMTVGLRFINDTFGESARPTISWHIDPFGHSAEQASLFSLMSFDGFFLGRIDHADKDIRLKEQRMEMVWRGSRNYEKTSQIFTGVTYSGYRAPSGFCFDQLCSDPPIQDDPRLFDMNVKERVNLFVEEACKQAKSFKTNHIMMTMGEDFMYENANLWFKNLDKLIKYVNQDGNINVFYSSPSRYLKALHDANMEWGVKTDDFFPYSHCPHCYWTGYFTSRPALKRYIWKNNNLLQVCKQLEVINAPFETYPKSETLKKAMAVNQHHDAVTGTEKQPVAFDYAKRLAIGEQECQDLVSKVIGRKYNSTIESYQSREFTFCNYLNVSSCPITEEGSSIVINIYNPIGRPVDTYIRFPIKDKNMIIINAKGNAVKSQIVPVSKATKQLRGRLGNAPYEIIFLANVPAVGFNTYFANTTDARDKTKHKRNVVPAIRLKAGNTIIENEKLQLEFSSETGRLIKMGRKDLSLSIDVDQQFFWYNGSTGNEESRQTSGAYIFRPNSSIPFQVCKENIAKVVVVDGPIVQEIRQSFGAMVSQVVRLYVGAPFAEFEYTVGPIPIGDGLGKEIITRFDTLIKSNKIFYTDANGREIQERIRDYRATWPLTHTEPVSENYYPVNSRIYLKDASTQLTLMTDRSHGGSSIKDGSLEVMLHRRLLRDDFLGVGEALNETGLNGKGLIVTGKMRVLLTTPEEGPRYHRDLGEKIMMEPTLSFARNSLPLDKWLQSYTLVYSALTKPLPANVHLLTMETVSNDTMILRLEHFYEKDEDSELSKPATVSLEGLFVDFEITFITELNLSANQNIADKKQLNWHTKTEDGPNNNSSKKRFAKDGPKGDLTVELQPMAIRTFLANIQRH